MSGIGEGIGGAIEGALASQAVEPSQSGNPTERGENAQSCSNCGAPISGPYCQQCGQKAVLHRSLSAILHDLVHGVLHLDGKIWHTLPLLLFKPGKLTRRYIDGERAKFVSPMAMFLFSVFLMFAIFQMVGLSTPTTLGEDASLDSAATEFAENARAQAETERTKVLREIANLPQDASPSQREKLQADLDELNRAIAGAQGFEANAGGIRGEIMAGETGVELIDTALQKWRDNPALMLYKLQTNGYKFSWLLIPLSIPFVWLLFVWKRRFKAYDHAIFVTYSLSFMSLLFIVLSLSNAAGMGAGWVITLFATITPLHIYKHLKHTYELSRFSTLWRFLLLIIFVIFVLILFVQALLLLGAF